MWTDVMKRAEEVVEEYAFQNVYLISTYKCNWKCPFCLFRYQKEQDAPVEDILSRLSYSIDHSDRNVYIKITGGEPFLRLDLLEKVFDLCNSRKDRIYKIGIGSNGSVRVPGFFGKLAIRTHIFLSRHAIKDELPKPEELRGFDNPLVDFRLNCNLINGGVDSLPKIEEYIRSRMVDGITHVCFRELSRVDLDASSIYPEEVVQYDRYYRDHLVPVKGLLGELGDNPRFKMSRMTGNYYDTNWWYWYDAGGGTRISVKFRAIDEARLLEFNRKESGVDEYVIHPDGTLTGCWDKDMKVIVKGGE